MSRLLDRQRQLAEAGRLRLGLTVPMANGKSRPMRSEVWIFSSHSQELVIAAAALWGGTPEKWQPLGNGAEQWRVITKTTTIDAILPPGDPLTQAYEMWGKGGAVRRCDSATEQFSGSPCLCIAQFGDAWYEQPKGKVCDTKSRLKVLIPDLPGLGSYRLETGSFYAADEIAGMVDFIRSAVGDQALIPVRLRIEARTRVAGNETKQFVVPVVELRGVTTGELLAGSGQQLGIGQKQAGTGQNQPAIAATPAPAIPDYLAELGRSTSVDDCTLIWRTAGEAGHLSDELKAAITAKAAEITAAGFQAPGSAPETATSAAGTGPDPASDAGPDADALWVQIVAEAGRLDMDDAALRAELHNVCGVFAEDATGEQLATFLHAMQTGEVAA